MWLITYTDNDHGLHNDTTELDPIAWRHKKIQDGVEYRLKNKHIFGNSSAPTVVVTFAIKL